MDISSHRVHESFARRLLYARFAFKSRVCRPSGLSPMAVLLQDVCSRAPMCAVMYARGASSAQKVNT
jgi:hypothetical protein